MMTKNEAVLVLAEGIVAIKDQLKTANFALDGSGLTLAKYINGNVFGAVVFLENVCAGFVSQQVLDNGDIEEIGSVLAKSIELLVSKNVDTKVAEYISLFTTQSSVDQDGVKIYRTQLGQTKLSSVSVEVDGKTLLMIPIVGSLGSDDRLTASISESLKKALTERTIGELSVTSPFFKSK